jgi:hypothetical protein
MHRCDDPRARARQESAEYRRIPAPMEIEPGRLPLLFPSSLSPLAGVVDVLAHRFR